MVARSIAWLPRSAWLVSTRDVDALGQVLSKQTIGVLVAASLPWATWIAEADLDVARQGEALVVGHLLASIPGQRPYSSCGSLREMRRVFVAAQMPTLQARCAEVGRVMLEWTAPHGATSLAGATVPAHTAPDGTGYGAAPESKYADAEHHLAVAEEVRGAVSRGLVAVADE